jgi:hypothetical protein
MSRVQWFFRFCIKYYLILINISFFSHFILIIWYILINISLDSLHLVHVLVVTLHRIEQLVRSEDQDQVMRISMMMGDLWSFPYFIFLIKKWWNKKSKRKCRACIDDWPTKIVCYVSFLRFVCCNFRKKFNKCWCFFSTLPFSCGVSTQLVWCKILLKE